MGTQGYSRREFIRVAGVGGAGLYVLARSGRLLASPAVHAVPLAAGLSDPALQPKFVNLVPNAADPAFSYKRSQGKKSKYDVEVGPSTHFTGLTDPITSTALPTPIFGYGAKGTYTWPGRTIFARSGEPVEVKWKNKLLDPVTGAPLPHILPVDESLHWAYSLPGYEQYDIATNGIPIVAHVHGGHTDFEFDGNPEFFFGPAYNTRGPQWVQKNYVYEMDQPAGTIWYHDHALGITRLNVYAGMAGFFIVHDDDDTGQPGNELGLPAFPYEAAFAIQDRMFRDTGELFYPAFPGDPFYDDFITGEGVVLPDPPFVGGGPTALAEFFGDHIVVNGVIWPKMDVEPRNYRVRFLNGCDSRFLAIQFFEVPITQTDFSTEPIAGPLPFTVIGSDQGLASAPTEVDTLVMETGSRYDLIIDFKHVDPGNRVIMRNLGGDSPFGGAFGDDLEPEDLFPDRQTDRIMAFDVVLPRDPAVLDASPVGIDFGPDVGTPTRLRKVALFEGKDEFGRLQPLLGTARPATDFQDNPIHWPTTPEYTSVGLIGQMEGSIAWHSPTTENPALNSTEEWEIWNVTGDAHPVHLHLVHFEILGRRGIRWDSATSEEDRVLEVDPESYVADGTYLVTQPTVQHNSVAGNPDTYGTGFRIVNPTYGDPVPAGDLQEYVENAPKDMVTALPDQITRIKATFDKPGRYVWHCHILSHEDHEMMRVLHVGPGA